MIPVWTCVVDSESMLKLEKQNFREDIKKVHWHVFRPLAAPLALDNDMIQASPERLEGPLLVIAS